MSVTCTHTLLVCYIHVCKNRPKMSPGSTRSCNLSYRESEYSYHLVTVLLYKYITSLNIAQLIQNNCAFTLLTPIGQDLIRYKNKNISSTNIQATVLASLLGIGQASNHLVK